MYEILMENNKSKTENDETFELKSYGQFYATREPKLFCGAVAAAYTALGAAPIKCMYSTFNSPVLLAQHMVI